MAKYTARYTDGKTSAISDVFLHLYKNRIGLFSDEALSREIDRWGYEDIRVNHDWIESIGGSFEHKKKYGATLSIENKDLFRQIRQNLKQHDRSTYLISTRAVTLISLVIVTVAIVVFGFPFLSRSSGALAYLVPETAERKIGDLALRSLGSDFESCEDETAKKYLETILDRLLESYDGEPIAPEIHFYKTDTVNAFAVPGQNMAVLTGFLKDAESEEEIAGVLAHELGHIANSDPLKYLIQEEGLGAISSLASSGSSAYGDMAKLTTTLSSLDYSREQEFAADHFALTLLQQSGYTTKGLIDFLTRTEEKSPALVKSLQSNLSFLSTHPETVERIKRLEMEPKKYKPSLTRTQMKRLRAACTVRLLSKEPGYISGFFVNFVSFS